MKDRRLSIIMTAEKMRWDMCPQPGKFEDSFSPYFDGYRVFGEKLELRLKSATDTGEFSYNFSFARLVG